MAKKPSQKLQANTKVIKRPRVAPSPADVAAAAQIVAAAGATPAITAMYEVLTPFKFRGARVIPPTWLELTDDEAKPYQDAGVLGTEPGEVPTDTDDDASSTKDDSGAKEGATPADNG